MREDWVETKLEEIVIKMTNGSSAKQHNEKIGLPISRIETIWNEGIDFERVKYVEENDEEFIEKYSLQNNDILLSHINSDSHLGKTAIYKTKYGILIHGINLLLLRPSKELDADFINYQFKHIRFRGNFVAVAQRAVNQSSINQQKLKQFDIKLPPLLEQKAIVAKIEQLFSELDNGIANLKTAQAKLKIYRQAVLKKAFERIPQINFEQIIHSSQNGLSKRSGKEGEFYKVLRLADIKNFQIVENEPRSIQMNQTEIEKYKLEINDLICTRVNGSKDLVGTFTLYQNDTKWAFCDHFIRLKLNQNSISKFYFYFLQTREVRKYIHDNMVSSAGQNTVSQTTIKAIQVPTCLQEEQKQIVQEIESRLSVCDKIEETIEITLAKSEALRQSILKKAFEGKLLSEQELENIKNHPEYENAEELLKRIKKEKAK